jgi:hypothetical protein
MANFWNKEFDLNVIPSIYEIQDVAEEMVRQTKYDNCLVTGVFKGIKLTTTPNMTESDIINQYERKAGRDSKPCKCPFYPAMILGNKAVYSLRDVVRDYINIDSDDIKYLISSTTFVSLTADKFSDNAVVCPAFDRKNYSCIAKNTLAYSVCETLRKELHQNNVGRKWLSR